MDCAPTPRRWLSASSASPDPGRRPRLRRSDCTRPGWRRVGRGRGFSYFDEHGRPIRDRALLERVSALAIPPAWKDVWICPDPQGHLQACGFDAAGRKQYVYHVRWRAHRDREKFDRMLRFARALPRLRRRILADLDTSPEPTRERVLALAARLLDVGLFRIGGEQYADEEGGFGLATIRSEHVSLRNGAVVFDYLAKGGQRRIQTITDPLSRELLRRLKRRRSGPDELLAYHVGREWLPIRSDDINDYLKRQIGDEFSAKDFRTLNATVLAAVSLASEQPPASTRAGRERAVKRAIAAVAELLGNTPAVARRAYIDPRVFDRYISGAMISLPPKLHETGLDDRLRGRIERSVLQLLDD